MNVTGFIRALARTHPDATAMIRPDDTSVSFRELDSQIDTVARRAIALGIAPGHVVGLPVGAPDEALSLVVALGLARIGVTTADLDLPGSRLTAAFVPTGITPPPGIPAHGFDLSWLAAPAGDPVPIHDDGAAILRICSTSGTSGIPRHCAVSHAAMAARIASHDFPAPTPGEKPVLICAMGLGSAVGLRAVLTALGQTGTLVFTNPARIMNAILRHKVTALSLSAGTLQKVLGQLPAGIGPLPPLRIVRVSGSRLPPKLGVLAASRLCRTIVTTFGATEIGTVANIPFGGPETAILLPDAEVQAVDDGGTPVPAGTEGRLRFRSPGMINAYLDDDAATRATFHDGWFYSGDRGVVTADRTMIVNGRASDFINSGGIKVDPRAIEAVLLSLPEVGEAVAFGVPDADGLPQIWAAITADPPVEKARIDRLCGQKLGQRAPKFVMQLKDLPRNANGKVVTAPLIEYAASTYLARR